MPSKRRSSTCRSEPGRTSFMLNEASTQKRPWQRNSNGASWCPSFLPCMQPFHAKYCVSTMCDTVSHSHACMSPFNPRNRIKEAVAYCSHPSRVKTHVRPGFLCFEFLVTFRGIGAQRNKTNLVESIWSNNSFNRPLHGWFQARSLRKEDQGVLGQRENHWGI